MALSGRVPLLLLLGLVPVVLRPTTGTVWLWVLAVLVLTAADWLLAPRPDVLTCTRRPIGTVRLGTPTESTLLVVNTSRRRVRARVRDAWQPTAGAAGNRHAVRLAADDRVVLRTPLLPRRRGDLRAVGVTLRVSGPLGLAAR